MLRVIDNELRNACPRVIEQRGVRWSVEMATELARVCRPPAGRHSVRARERESRRSEPTERAYVFIG